MRRGGRWDAMSKNQTARDIKRRCKIVQPTPVKGAPPGPCSKARHESEQDAEAFAASSEGPALRAYYCVLCDGYHLTSIPVGVRTRRETKKGWDRASR